VKTARTSNSFFFFFCMAMAEQSVLDETTLALLSSSVASASSDKLAELRRRVAEQLKLLDEVQKRCALERHKLPKHAKMHSGPLLIKVFIRLLLVSALVYHSFNHFFFFFFFFFFGFFFFFFFFFFNVCRKKVGGQGYRLWKASHEALATEISSRTPHEVASPVVRGESQRFQGLVFVFGRFLFAERRCFQRNSRPRLELWTFRRRLVE
jgi:hypothetical protein